MYYDQIPRDSSLELPQVPLNMPVSTDHSSHSTNSRNMYIVDSVDQYVHVTS